MGEEGTEKERGLGGGLDGTVPAAGLGVCVDGDACFH